MLEDINMVTDLSAQTIITQGVDKHLQKSNAIDLKDFNRFGCSIMRTTPCKIGVSSLKDVLNDHPPLSAVSMKEFLCFGRLCSKHLCKFLQLPMCFLAFGPKLFWKAHGI